MAMKRVWPQWVRAYARAVFPGCRILLPGCGKGGTLRHFRDPQCWATGCDLDREALALAAPVLPVCVADIYRLPYRAEVFDAVFLDWVLEHLADADGALAECVRVLKRNGMVAVLTTNPHSPLGWAARAFPRLGSLFWKRALDMEQSVWETKHARNSAGALTRRMSQMGMRRVALHRISHMEYYALNLKSLVPLAAALIPLVRLYDSICLLPPFSLLANAYVALFQKM